MATRNLIMVVDREHAKKPREGFACSPNQVSEYSYVNMYMHHDGYPEWQGVQLANWINHFTQNKKMRIAHRMSFADGSRVAARLVRDHYYDSCYLYPNENYIDHNYTYIIWTGKKDVWVSCWDAYSTKNIFVLTPDKIIKRYKTDMDYTDWSQAVREDHI